MKPDPARLRRDVYPVAITVPTRFRDLDPLGHINNVAIGSFYEEARATLNRRAFPEALRERHAMRMLIADVHIAYLGEAHYPGVLEVAAGIERIGNTSYTIALALFQEGACVGVCETVIVNTDGTAPAPIPEKGRRALEALRLKTTVGTSA